MPVLEVTDLKKSYVSPDGERNLIVDVPSFVLDDAAHVALQGYSGSGKTTFLNLIAGILQADSGRVVLAGQTVTGLSEARRDDVRAAYVGYIFQTFNLLHGYTALENVVLAMSFGQGIDVNLARHLLERVGLADRLHYRPSQLSVGQQQRVAVARALANRPKLVLADEPTGNLDHRRSGAAMKLIRQICQENGAALLLVTHDSTVLAQFDTVVQLADVSRACAREDDEGVAAPSLSTP